MGTVKAKPVLFTLKPNVIEELGRIAEHKGLSKSAVVAIAIQEYTKSVARAIVEKEPFVRMIDKSGRRGESHE
jgi:hypothetical protein